MHTQCPECRHPFQAIDVDGVMSERKLIHEILEESRLAAQYKAERDEARRMWSIHQDRLVEAFHLIAEIMRDKVNVADECEKFLRAYAPQHLFPANAEAIHGEKGATK